MKKLIDQIKKMIGGYVLTGLIGWGFVVANYPIESLLPAYA